MTITTKIQFDDGDALSEDVRRHGKLIGAIWTEGEGLGWQARATSNVAGYWRNETTDFETRDAALTGLTNQARFEFWES